MIKEFHSIPKNIPKSIFLDKINIPADLRKLDREDLGTLANELRELMIYLVGNNGGHFASGLGVVELTVALHYVFNTPNDDIVWDVGHQSYPHKILTGRKDKIDSIRKFGGLSPFLDPTESEYDSFISGHSSTSISAALGMQMYKSSIKDASKTIAVIGDGALTGGMAFEALNHAGNTDEDIVVILNDNNMSISENVGGMSKHFSAFFASSLYQGIRDGHKKLPKFLKYYNNFLDISEKHFKDLVLKNNIFESLGFQYFGPIDGHDIKFLTKILGNIKQTKGPVLLHIVTQKGRGYAPAEKNPISFHAINKHTESVVKKTATYANVFARWINKTAKEDKRLHAVTPAMCEGSDLVEFKNNFPDRYHDVGIAEQHALTFSAGMAKKGAKAVVAIYSSFLQRGYDQLIHDICLQNLDITIAIDRSGIVGGDGSTHHGVFDLSFMRALPNIIILTPSSGKEMFAMLDFSYHYDGVVAIRYPRGSISEDNSIEEFENNNNQPNNSLSKIEIGKIGEIFDYQIKNTINTEFASIVMFSFGSMLNIAKEVGKKLNILVVDMRFVKPLDANALINFSNNYDKFITLEENVISGGAGSGVNEFFAKEQIVKPILNIGLEDRFYTHGDCDLVKKGTLDFDSVMKKVTKFIN